MTRIASTRGSQGASTPRRSWPALPPHMRLALLLVPLAACSDQATQDPVPLDRTAPETFQEGQGPTLEELEGLALPDSVTAMADEPGGNEFRPAVRVMQDGSIWSDNSHALGRSPAESWPDKVDSQLYGPTDSNDLEALGRYLARMARLMELRAPAGGQTSSKLKIDPLLIRADQLSPFRSTQKLMEQCCAPDVQIWRLQLATAEGKLLRVYIPKDFGVWGEDRMQVSIAIEVVHEGNRLDEGGTRAYDPTLDQRFTYDGTRQLSYQVASGVAGWEEEVVLEEVEGDGAEATSVEPEEEGTSSLAVLREQLVELDEANGKVEVVIDAGPGTVTQDVVDVLDAVMAAGFEQVTFAGPKE